MALHSFRGFTALVAISTLTGCAATELLAQGEDTALREPVGLPSPGVGVFVLALDGLGRDVLYEELEAGRLPALTRLLGGSENERFPHAYLERQAVTTFPSATAVAWATAFTGERPADHGVTGNEMFLRPSGRFVAPVPMSLSDNAHLLAIYTGPFLDEILEKPTVYQKLHQGTEGVVAWVALNHVHAGADRLFMPDRADLVEGWGAWMGRHLVGVGEREMFATIDVGAIEAVMAALDEHPAPDVLTLYLSGTDTFTHVADGADVQRAYLREVLDPKLDELLPKLARRGPWYTLVIADHGHTPVHRDEEHSLEYEGESEPPEVLRRAGFRVRPLGLDVEDEPFDAAFAYQGGCAYVYLADRSRCDDEGRCDFTAPPRYDEDVLAAAEAFFRANATGARVPGIRGTLDAILVREPRPFDEVDRPFSVYLGERRTVEVERHFAAHPELGGPRFVSRLHDLTVGRFGERAGDLILVARQATAEGIDRRHYFSRPYASSHGSASESDSAIPFVLSHPDRSATELETIVREVAGDEVEIADAGKLIRALVARAKAAQRAPD